MSGLLAAIGCALLGLAVGAALQRWGDADRATHGHKIMPETVDALDEFYRETAYAWRGW